MRKFSLKIYAFLFVLLAIASLQTTAQCTVNILTNGGFDAPLQPAFGNNLTGLFTFNGWTMTGGPFNVIKTDGSVYGGGPDNAKDGNQYVDITSAAGDITQDFTVACVTDLTFSGYFSHRENGGSDFTAYIEIINVGTGLVVATSSVLNFTSTTDQDIWFVTSGTALSVPAGNYRYRAVVADYCNFDAAFLCANACTLPVKLNKFDAAFENCESSLKWSTSNETNFKEYQIEYSATGINFAKVATVMANTAPISLKEYQYTHNTVSPKSYYRLKQIDVNGAFQYSKIIALNTNCNKAEVTVYPNPATEVLNINITNNSRTALLSTTIYDSYGKKIVAQQLKNGTNSLNIKHLPTGMYQVSVNNGGTVSNQKIIIQ
jgi:Secretion system C-terminal sorting domain